MMTSQACMRIKLVPAKTHLNRTALVDSMQDINQISLIPGTSMNKTIEFGSKPTFIPKKIRCQNTTIPFERQHPTQPRTLSSKPAVKRGNRNNSKRLYFWN